MAQLNPYKDPLFMLENNVSIDRRLFLQASLSGVAIGASTSLAAETKTHEDLKGEVGITTGSLMRHLTVEPAKGKIRLLDLPKLMRDELDMKVIDLLNETLASMEPTYLDKLRKATENAGCIITNLKMNLDIDMASPDKSNRRAALDEYKRTIDAAERLGCRWVRPLPRPERPDVKLFVDGYSELIDYAQPKGISLLIENFGWMTDDPKIIPKIIKAAGPGLAASPDTGNWTNEARYEGLAEVFPHAVTCDFKANQFDGEGNHTRYDLQRCFQIGWDAGYRGPWCLEHFNTTLDGLIKGFAKLRMMLNEWAGILTSTTNN